MLIANAYPGENEVTDGLRPRSSVRPLGEIFELAKRTIEVLVREPVRPCRYAGFVFLDSGIFKLPHFPVRHLHVAERHVYHVNIDEENGILAQPMVPDSYQIIYEVGYTDGNVPAIIKTLIVALSRYLYSGNDEFRSEIAELVGIARRIRKIAKDRRNDYKVDREGSRERFARHSPSGLSERSYPE